MLNKKNLSFNIIIALIIMMFIETKLKFGIFSYIKNYFMNGNFFNYLNIILLFIIGFSFLAIINKAKKLYKINFLLFLDSYITLFVTTIEKMFNIIGIDKNLLFNINIISILFSLFFATKILKEVRKVIWYEKI